MIFTTI